MTNLGGRGWSRAFAILIACAGVGAASGAVPVRPPAVPLVACDPYFSVWSPGDQLAGVDTVHWTGKPHRLGSWIRVDDRTYWLMGATPEGAVAMTQTGLAVWPTRTVYRFEGGGLALTLTFLTPALPDDLEVLSRPVTYLTYEMRATDGREHAVSVGLSAGAELAVNVPSQRVQASVGAEVEGLAVMAVRSQEQPILAKRGDDLRIDWGRFMLAAPKETVMERNVGERAKMDAAAVKSGRLSAEVVGVLSGPAEGASVAMVLNGGKVGAAAVQRWAMVAYDDVFSIQYMKRNLRPYWRRNGGDDQALLAASAREREALVRRCEAFDAELMADLERVGGPNYAALGALAYRQCFAAGKFVADANGKPLQFCKENHSNGCIATSDVFYPMAPQFLLFGPTLTKSFLVPFMNYATSERWKFPFAPHDLGTYPHANGQVYGGGERTEENQMPVEETGNLLILMGALAQMEGNAGFASLYWPQLQRWADYLVSKGFDPENQLCTDDFAGHLAHNVNLSAKAICGLGAFAKLCDLRGEAQTAARYRGLAEEFARRWVKEAADGDHYRLAFDKPGSWSQKYNLVWDRVLGLKLFPPEVARTEMAYYRRMQNEYGLPLDNRETYTKLDWILWTATLTGERSDFDALLEPVMRFVNATPDRSPLTDWYQTKTAKKVGFTARPVIGGVFLPMLQDGAMWKKYASRDKANVSGWAPMPQPPKVSVVVPSARDGEVRWKYRLEEPTGRWQETQYDDTAWSEGVGGFGSKGTPSASVGTEWKTGAIWLRRVVEIPAGTKKHLEQLQVLIHHDEDAEVYWNGTRLLSLTGYSTDYETVPLAPVARAVLQEGRNVIAVHCRQTGGGQYIDVGLVRVEEVDAP
ncbi:MAG: DUF4965 domain-containing protein [Verrucomicrobiales bacterium]|nr:DUF4965 domain-containing protein [Verrucomicrobiales bacterium]